jgi:hypothetical protein
MWLIVPESFPCSQVGEDWTSLSESQSQRLEQSAMWRSKLRRSRLWRLAWRKDPSIRRLSGATYEPLTADLGVSVWMESSAGSPVRTSAMQGSAPASAESAADCSLNTSESFARCNHDGSLLRTSPQLSLIPLEESYSENLPGSGSMRNGYLYEHRTSEPRTSGNERSSWPTVQWRTPDAPGSGGPRNHRTTIGNGRQVTIAEQAEQWGTPTSRDYKDGACVDADVETNGLLGRQVLRNWATPSASDPERGDRSRLCAADLKAGMDINTQARNWQTPATDSFRSRGGARKDEMGLDQQARKSNWPTPDASVMNDGESATSRKARQAVLKEKRYNGNGAGMPLAIASLTDAIRQVSFLPDPETSMHGDQSSPTVPTSRRRLNPAFVSWLMGWPIHWVIREPIPSGCSETELYLSRQRMHLSCLLGEQVSGSEIHSQIDNRFQVVTEGGKKA